MAKSLSCPGLSRASTSYRGDSKKDVDGRDESGHAERSVQRLMVRSPRSGRLPDFLTVNTQTTPP
jgi:hypothetical protein